MACSPAVEISNDSISIMCGVVRLDVCQNPFDQVVLEGSFYDLMQEIGRQSFVYVGTREMVRVRLVLVVSISSYQRVSGHYDYARSNTECVP